MKFTIFLSISLPFYKSDHRSLLVKFESHPRSNSHRRPFRFEEAWLTHHGCDKVIREAWQPDVNHFPQQLSDVQSAVKVWNKNSVGHIFKRKKQLRSELAILDKRLTRNWTQQLAITQKETWKLYEEVLA